MMHQSRPRKPRFQRVADAPSLVLTSRDLEIFKVVGRHRFIQSHHLLRLFPGSRQHLIRRLGKLFHAGFLARPHAQLWISDKIAPSLACCLTLQGRNLLRERSSLPVPSVPRLRATAAALSLAHSLRLTDVLVALEASAAQRNISFQWPVEWPSMVVEENRRAHQLQWSVTLQRDQSTFRTLLIPDGAFSLQASRGETRYFVLEVDRGTMPVSRRKLVQSSFQRKIMAYQETRRQGVLWKKFQAPAFRVLVVAESRRRLAALQLATASSFKRGESTMFLFAVAAELLAQPVALTHVWETCAGAKVQLLGE